MHVTEQPKDNHKNYDRRDYSASELPGNQPGKTSTRRSFHLVSPLIMNSCDNVGPRRLSRAAPLKGLLAVSSFAARRFFLFLLLVLTAFALLGLLALLFHIVVRLLIVFFTGFLSTLSALSIFWHGFVSLLPNSFLDRTQASCPVSSNSFAWWMIVIEKDCRDSCAAKVVSLHARSRLHGYTVDDSSDAFHGARDLLGSQLQVVIRHLSAESRCPARHLHVDRIGAQVGVIQKF